MKKAGKGCLSLVLLIAILVIAGAILSEMGGGGDETTPTPTEIAGFIEGTIDIADGQWDYTAEGCVALAPWDGMNDGGELQFMNQSGESVSTNLRVPGLVYEDENGDRFCVFAFRAPMIEATTYTIEVSGITATCSGDRFYDQENGLLVAVIASNGTLTCKSLD